MSFVDLATLKARVTANIDDPALQLMIDGAERFLSKYMGLLEGERSETYVLPRLRRIRGLFLARPTDSVTLTSADDPVPITDYELHPDGVTIEFLTRIWRSPVVATYTPNDGDLVREAIIDLVAGRVARATSGLGALEYEQIGSYSRRFSTRGPTAQAEADVLAPVVSPVEVSNVRFWFA